MSWHIVSMQKPIPKMANWARSARARRDRSAPVGRAEARDQPYDLLTESGAQAARDHGWPQGHANAALTRRRNPYRFLLPALRAGLLPLPRGERGLVGTARALNPASRSSDNPR